MNTPLQHFETKGFWERIFKTLEISFTGSIQRIAIIVGILYCILQPTLVFIMNATLELSSSSMILIFITMLLINVTISLFISVAVILQLSYNEYGSTLEISKEKIISSVYGYFMTYMATWRYYMPPLLLMLAISICMLIGMLAMNPETSHLTKSIGIAGIDQRTYLGPLMIIGTIGILVGIIWFIRISYSVIFCGVIHVRNNFNFQDSIEYCLKITTNKKLWIFGNIFFSGIIFTIITGFIGGTLTGIIGGENDYNGNISQAISKFLPEELAHKMNEKTGTLDTNKKPEITMQSILSDSITGALNGLSTLVFTVFFYLLFIRTEQDFKNLEDDEGEDE